MPKVKSYVPSERFIQVYRGTSVYQYRHNGMYTALTSQGSVRSDTLAGIRQAIRDAQKK